MANAELSPLIRQIRKLATGPSMADPPDEYLLDRFVTDRDEAAFALLVRRHGPFVLGVCRHVLRHTQDAEDAYQASFLVLARRAASIRNPKSLPSWLHGVAYRTAMKAKRDAGRRRAHERQAPSGLKTDPSQELAWREVQAALDEEIQRLPEVLRAPFVLCCLLSRSHAEAASQLGLKEKTVSSRLTRARARLQRQLARRGVALATVLGATAAMPSLSAAAVPALLMESTIDAALAFAAGASPRAGTNLLPENVLALVKGAIKPMFATKVKIVTALLMVAGVAVAGGRLLVQGSPAEEAAGALLTDAPQAQEPAAEFLRAGTPKRQATETGKLLNQLDELRTQRGEDEWAGVLRELIQLGPKAVPELIAEMDATHDEAMLRCLAFVVRGIGDKRALPALIRALPKTCVSPGSDYGFIANDPDLLAFMQKHDMENTQPGGTHYAFGRAVNEFRVTLQRWTRAKQGEDEIVNVFLEGTPRQQYLQRSLYHRCAERWAKWWEVHWKEHVKDERYARVNLAPLSEEPGAGNGFPHGPDVKLNERRAGHVLEAGRNPKAKHVFLDLDTGRQRGLPAHLRAAAGQPERLDDILAWASREGFDLMGTEYRLPGEENTHYVLRGIGLALWQIETERWKTLEEELRDKGPLNMGTRTDGLLAPFDAARGQYLPEETATFLFQTREGSYGAIFVGVEVHDDSLKAGGAAPADIELSPIAFYKGRRFAYVIVTGPVARGEGRRR
jgi:RNA polymerase sigma factor (sigma-70 family)